VEPIRPAPLQAERSDWVDTANHPSLS